MGKPVLVPPTEPSVNSVKLGDYLVYKKNQTLTQLVTIEGKLYLINVLNGSYFHNPGLNLKESPIYSLNKMQSLLACDCSYSLENWEILTREEAAEIIRRGHV